MRAAVLKELGGVPEFDDFDEPEAAEGFEVLDVAVAGLNPIDIYSASGNHPAIKPEPPCVPGLEGIGTRADGSRVYFFAAPPNGAIAERVASPVASFVEVPDGVDDATAVCFGIAGTAGWLALEWSAKVQEGETVLVLGSSGVVGQIAVQGAKLLGAGRVIAAARNEDSLAEAAELGADATVPITEEGFSEALREAAPDGIDVIIDPVWGKPAMDAIDAGATRVRLIQIGNAAGEAELSPPHLRNKLASIIGHSNFLVPPEDRADAFRKMCEHAAAGELRADSEEVPLADIADAWKRQAEGPGHKLVIRVS